MQTGHGAASRWSATNCPYISEFHIFRKEAWQRIASLPSPGSFLDEKMLVRIGQFTPQIP